MSIELQGNKKMQSKELHEPKFTIKEVSRLHLLGDVSEATIRREIGRKKLAAYRVGGKIFVSASHINQYLSSNEQRVAETA